MYGSDIEETCFSYLTKTLEDSVLKELALMYIMLWKEDAELEKSMRSVELGALFALSWPLTWFSHSLHHYEQVVFLNKFLLIINS